IRNGQSWCQLCHAGRLDGDVGDARADVRADPPRSADLLAASAATTATAAARSGACHFGPAQHVAPDDRRAPRWPVPLGLGGELVGQPDTDVCISVAALRLEASCLAP